MPVSVIIPTLNEEAWIAGAVESAFAAGAAEVIVADGGSGDRTARYATAAGARVLLTEALRARQLNRGAEAATSDVLIFLHADSRLPAGAALAAEVALAKGRAFGGFRIRFLEQGAKLRVAAALINLRTAITRAPWGDQGQFIGRDTFLANPYREIPIMEDYEFAMRMRPAVVLPLTITSSGRRFLKKGLLRTAIVNWLTIWRYHRGADPQKLARAYREE
jgi:rSAM/selenodomain-associated transferase 2